jgi:hypothetical protein
MTIECVVGVHTLNSYNKILERILFSDDPRGYPPSPKAGGVWGGESTAHVNIKNLQKKFRKKNKKIPEKNFKTQNNFFEKNLHMNFI